MTDEKTALLVMNPVSGISDSNLVRTRFETVFQEAGWSFEVITTDPHTSTTQRVERAVAKGVQMVIAAGGDGTVSEVAHALVGTDIPMGILPAGTGNALARNLGIPIALEGALSLLLKPHETIMLDALWVQDRYYLLNVGIGLSASLIDSTTREEKRRFGYLAYLWHLITQASGLSLKPFRLTIDGKLHRVWASEVMVINSSIVGLGELKAFAELNADDGKVEILAVRAPTIFGLAWIAVKYVLGNRQRGTGYITYTAQKSISIQSRRTEVVQADGDVIGKTPIEIQVRPAAVKIIVPPA